jgi:hypothetical protein
MNAVLRRTGPLFCTLFLPFLAEGCIFSASHKEWTPEPWPEGGFEIQASTGTTTYSGELYIAPDGRMTFSTTAGTCAERTSLQVERDRSMNQRTFSCSAATFLITPRGGTVQGRAQIPVNRTVRGARFCATYGENGQCVHYEYRDRTVNTVENVTLRVVRKG